MINRWLVITPLSALPLIRARTTPLLPSPAGPPFSGSHHLQCLHDSRGLPASTLDPLLSTLNTTARGVLLSLNHILFFSCLPPHLAACPARWGHVATPGPHHLPISHFPVLPPHWPFSYSSTLIPQSLGKCCFSPFGKLFQTPMWLTSHFPSGIC